MKLKNLEHGIPGDGLYLLYWDRKHFYNQGKNYNADIRISLIFVKGEEYFYIKNEFWIIKNEWKKLIDKNDFRGWHWRYNDIAPKHEVSYLRILPQNPMYLIHVDLNLDRYISDKTRLKIYRKDNFKCCLCNKSPAIDKQIKLTIDHIYPLAMGGSNHISNLQTLCNICNSKKSINISNA